MPKALKISKRLRLAWWALWLTSASGCAHGPHVGVGIINCPDPKTLKPGQRVVCAMEYSDASGKTSEDPIYLHHKNYCISDLDFESLALQCKLNQEGGQE